ncbi:MAG: response regulator transcription factor [Myxococcaceae bacterium]
MTGTNNSEVRLALLTAHALIRESLARVLTAAGLQVVGQSGDTSEFLHIIDQTRPPAAVIDSGGWLEESLAMVERLKQLHPDVSTLVLADDIGPGVVDRCFQAGAKGCLDKRYTGCDALIDAVGSVARGANIFPAQSFESLLQKRQEPDSRVRVLGQLSVREREVLAYISAGADNLKIASHLGISERTVKAHVSSLYRKLNQENRTQIALLARELGVRPPLNV